MKRIYDSAWPVSNPPPWLVSAFYLGGDTPHAWSAAEIYAQPARYRLPIWVFNGSDSQNTGISDASAALANLHALKVPPGVAIALDTETSVLSDYIRAFNHDVTVAGYEVINYGSLDYVIKNPDTSGGRWSAHWDNVATIDDGYNIVATQFADSVQLHTGYDASVIEDHVPLWDYRPPAPPPVTTWESVALDEAKTARQHLDKVAGMLLTHQKG